MGVVELNQDKVVETDAILIVGAGLVGSLAALTLARRGLSVIMVERSDDWEVVSDSGQDEQGDDASSSPEGERTAAKDRSALKRSINLALSFRGKEALRNAGVLNEAMEFTIPMHGRALHTDTSGEGSEACQSNGFQPYDETDSSNFIHSVGREHLNKLLVNKAREYSGVQVMFGMRLTHVDKEGVAHFEDRAEVMTSLNTYNDFSQGRYRIKPR
jgi:kynurenine 3-monooxygenase